MITIEEAVSRSIERFLNEDIFTEKNRKGVKHHTHKKGKKAIKKRNGQRGDYDYDNAKNNNPNVSKGDQEALAKVVKDDALNLAPIAQEVYPDHTKEGAQSQLRKKIEGELSDSGTKYKLNKKEAKRLRRALNQRGFI